MKKDKTGLYNLAQRNGYIIGGGTGLLKSGELVNSTIKPDLKFKSIRLEVNGKNRIIRASQIIDFTEHRLEATYAGYDIEIQEQDTGGYYVRAVNSEITFGTAVDGFFDKSTILDCLKMCLKNVINE